MIDFSPETRQRWITGNPHADFLVIGGGITGLGIALDAVSRGIDTLLVEKGDFAGGTSGKTTKLIHGGLRYLRGMQIGLVRESTAERAVLRRLAPHLVEEIPIALPATGGLNRAALGFGTWLYDLIGGFKGAPRKSIPVAGMRERLPGLAARFDWGGVVYHDAAADDCRLCFHVLKKAVELGARALSYTEVLGPVLEGGRLAGCHVRDRVGGREIEIRARQTVIATGAWSNELVERFGERECALVRPTKGIHLIVPRSRLNLGCAAALPSSRDGRLIFAIPRGRHVLIGTTDTDYEGSLDRPRAETADVAYLTGHIAESLGVNLGPGDFTSCTAGLRPLLDDADAVTPSNASREDSIVETRSGALVIVGGKLTTYRAMAARVVDRVLRKFGRPWVPSRTAELPLFACGPESSLPPGLDPEVRGQLVRNYGSEHFEIERIGRLRPLDESLLHVEGEIDYAVRHEGAITVPDVLSRRTRAVLYSADQGRTAARAVAARMAQLLGWSRDEESRQLDAYEVEVDLHRPAG